LARALSVVNIHLNRERAAFRFRSQVANRAPNRLEIVNPAIQALASRTPISISTVLSQLAGVGGQQKSLRGECLPLAEQHPDALDLLRSTR